MCEAQGEVDKLVYVMEKTTYIGGGTSLSSGKFQQTRQQFKPQTFRLRIGDGLSQTMLLPSQLSTSLEVESSSTHAPQTDHCHNLRLNGHTNGFTTMVHGMRPPESGQKQGKYLSQLSFTIGGNDPMDSSADQSKINDPSQSVTLDHDLVLKENMKSESKGMDNTVSTLQVFVNNDPGNCDLGSVQPMESLHVICSECDINDKEESVDELIQGDTTDNRTPDSFNEHEKQEVVAENRTDPVLDSSEPETTPKHLHIHSDNSRVENPWNSDDEEESSFRCVSTWPRQNGIPVIYVDENSESESETNSEEREEAEGGTLAGLPGLSHFLSEFHARARSPHGMYTDDNEDDLVKLKDMTKRLNLATRRESYTEWKDRYLNKPLLWRRRSVMTFNKDTREPKEVAKDVMSLPENDEEGWSEERRLRIDSALDWLKKELTEMRQQDQELARSLITLREDLREFKLRKCCAENQELIEEALDQEDERDVLSDLSDLPPSPFSPTLKNYGVTRMNISTRRFSVF